MISIRHFFATTVGLVLAACGATSGVALDDGDGRDALAQTQVFIAPNVGGLDYLDFFTKPDAWASARSKVSVFKFYEVHLRAPEEPQCGAANGTTFEALLAVDAFKKLESWNIAIGVEVPALKDWDCSGQNTATYVRDMLRRLQGYGVTVSYLSMDEPLLAGVESPANGGCALSQAEAARRVAEHIRVVRAEFPDVKYGSMDAYPHFSADKIKSWLADLESACGRPLDYEHLDVDFNAVKGAHSNLGADFGKLATYARERGIAFGPMTTANETGGPADHAGQNRFFYNTVMTEVGQVLTAMGKPGQIVIPSWYASCGNLGSPCDGYHCLIVPDNLPETASYTFTKLVNDAVARYGGVTPPIEPPTTTLTDAARLVSHTLPTSLTVGETRHVTVTLQNTGTATWTSAYRLGSPGDQDPFAAARVELPAGTSVAPGGTWAFAFDLVAPATPGVQLTDWRMVHEDVQWFGDTASVSITVVAAGGGSGGGGTGGGGTGGGSGSGGTSSTLASNELLAPNEARVSANGRFRLVYQGDGNLVLYKDGATPLWASNTNGAAAGQTVMQGDGNLVIYSAAGAALWTSRTEGHPGALLSVQDDGNAVIYSATLQPLWATNTNGR